MASIFDPGTKLPGPATMTLNQMGSSQLPAQPLGSSFIPQPQEASGGPPPGPVAQPQGGIGTDLSGLIGDFRSQFPVGGSNLMDPDTNRAATDFFGRILAQAGSDFGSLRDEIGPVRLGDRMRELLGKDVGQQSGIIQIGNGLAIDSNTGQVIAGGGAGGGGAQPASPAQAAPAAQPEFQRLDPFGTMTAPQFQFSPSQLAIIGNRDPALIEENRARLQGHLVGAEQQLGRAPHQLSSLPFGNPFWTREFRKGQKQGMSPQEAANFANNQFGPESVSRHGERTGNILDFFLDRFGSDRHTRDLVNAGAFGDVLQQTQAPPLTGGETLPPETPAFPQFGLPEGEIDEFSQIINDQLAQLGQGIGTTAPTQGIPEGQTGLDTLANLAETGGTNPAILDLAARNLEEELVRARRAGSASLMDQLAGRGLAGGGTATEGLMNLERDLREQQAQQLRDLSIAEQLAAQDRSLSAAGTLGGLDAQRRQQEIENFQQGVGNQLAALGEATERALGIGDLGLRNLEANLAFIEAMRALNLQEAQIVENIAQMRQGNVDNTLNMLVQMLNILQTGFV